MRAIAPVEAPRAPPSAALAGAVATWLAGLTIVFTLDDPRLRFPAFLAGAALATTGWLGALAAVRARPPSRRVLGVVVALAVAMRLWAVSLPPAFSEDVFRYLYEGRVVWHEGPAFPFVVPPADAAARPALPRALFDASWLRINHPEIPTIYPPFAQAVFVLAAGLAELAGGGFLVALKLALVVAELGAALLVAQALVALGRPRAEALVAVLCPLAILEIGREGHADSLSMFGLALGVWGFARARPAAGHAGFALAALAKLNGLVALFASARSTRRGLGVAIALLALLALPVTLGGPKALTALGTYASAWRAGDGVFTLVLELAGRVLGGDWRRIGALTVTQHQLARAMTAALYGVLVLAVLRRPAPEREVPARVGVLLLGLLLLSPTMHPWYTLWLLPFAALPGPARRASILLMALAPILHHPGWLELVGGTWTDVGWARALVHGPVWAVFLGDLARRDALG